MNFTRIKLELMQTGIILGGVVLSLLIFSLGSGVLLSFFYNPNPAETYYSMAVIAANPVKAFIRNFHFWSSDLLLFVLFLHLTRVALTKPSGKMRRYAWWVGVGLFIMIFAQMLIGTFLRGDQEAYEAYSHFFIGTTVIVSKYIPFITLITDFFSDNAAMFRFFIMHAVLLPIGITLLIVAHGFLAPTFRALTAPFKNIAVAQTPGIFSNHSIKRLLRVSCIAFFAVVVLSALLPAPLLSRPYDGIEVTKPPWWLLWVVALENTWGLTAIVIAPPLLFLIFALIPFFTKDGEGADFGVYLYLITLFIVIALSFWANLAPQTAHTEMFMEEHGSAGH